MKLGSAEYMAAATAGRARNLHWEEGGQGFRRLLPSLTHTGPIRFLDVLGCSYGRMPCRGRDRLRVSPETGVLRVFLCDCGDFRCSARGVVEDLAQAAEVTLCSLRVCDEHLSAATVEIMARAWPGLRFLDADFESPEVVDILAASFPNLVALNCPGTLLGDCEVESLAGGCTKLRYLRCCPGRLSAQGQALLAEVSVMPAFPRPTAA